MYSTKKEDKYTLLTYTFAELSSEAIHQLKEEVIKANTNIIFDVCQVEKISNNELEMLMEIYSQQFELGKSFVLANLKEDIEDQADDLDLDLNVAPTLNEAIDILFMEELEREL